jgi:hypothetical protein
LKVAKSVRISLADFLPIKRILPGSLAACLAATPDIKIGSLIMIARARIHRRSHSGKDRFCGIEPLENRTLLSAWSTVDSQPYGIQGVGGMTTDKSGNVYAVGDVYDASGDDFVLREKASGGSSWATLCSFGFQSHPDLNGVAVDAKGNVFVAGVTYATESWTVWELPQGSSSPVVIDRASGVAYAVAVDPAGSVYVAGGLGVTVKGGAGRQWAVRKGTFNSASGSWTFSTVDQVAAPGVYNANGLGIVTTTNGGVPSTAVYAVGEVGSNWVVRKSVNGGPWSQVDSFRYDSTGSAYSDAFGVAADPAGDVYVAGFGQKATITGYNKNRTPIYSYVPHWLVRKLASGGTSWTTDFASTAGNDEAAAICADPQTGAMDVAGYEYDSANLQHAVVRSNVTGAWAAVDDYTGSSASGASYQAIAADAAGNIYAGGASNDNGGSWFIRSQPAPPANLTASPDAAAPSSQIDLSWSNAPGSDETGFAVYRSTDGVNFTLLGTVSASITSYNDGGLAGGTTYYYYVVTLLNSDGTSAPSATVSARTSV